jgi:protoheme IX farnesyltransferase
MTTPTHPGRKDTPTVRLTHLLAASALGVYLLVVIGATTSLLDGAAACPTWPACNGRWIVSLSDPALAVAWGHRLVTLVVGLLLFGTTVAAWVRSVDDQVRFALGVAAILYPGQIALGAVTAVTGASILLSAAHLVVAMVIFSGLIVALLWHLESESVTSVAVVETDPIEADSDPEPTEQPSTTTHDRPNDESSIGYASPRIHAYLALTKPKLMWLLCLVALAAMGLAAGPTLNPWTTLATLAGGVLAIGASGTFNNVLERDVDRHMDRTADRPVVQGQIPPRRAIAFGVLLATASVVVFVTFVNVLAAALGLLAILFYSVVYTLVLKPHTTQNIVIGGAVGAFPALIGWAAVENTVGMPAVVLGAVIFLWTPAHFYNLALAYREDYAAAGLPMLPVVRGEATTRRHILLYLGATFLGAVVLGAVTRLDWLYAATIVLVGGVFLWATIKLFHERTEQAAFRTFHASNAYLGGLLVAILVDTLLV